MPDYTSRVLLAANRRPDVEPLLSPIEGFEAFEHWVGLNIGVTDSP